MAVYDPPVDGYEEHFNIVNTYLRDRVVVAGETI